MSEFKLARKNRRYNYCNVRAVDNISVQCSLSITLEDIKNSLVFYVFRGYGGGAFTKKSVKH